MATNDESNLVVSWGANSYGQLGLGDTVDRSIPTILTQSFCKLRQITGGGAHSLLLTEDGDLYGCGWNKEGQLATPPGSDATIPTHVTCLPKLVKVACGWSHTLSITLSGSVVVWGSNKYYQLGIEVGMDAEIGHHQLSSSLFEEESIVDIGAGMRHSAAVTESGVVYTWGDGKKGQLGHSKFCVIKSPTKVEALNGIVCASVALGAQFTAIRTESGEVYCCGNNRHRQCTMSDSNTVPLPYMVKGLPPIIEVHCGWSHCVAVSAEGQRVFVWGRGDYGQLGNGDRRNRSEPLELPELRGVNQIASGSEHNVALNGLSQVVTWGWNEHGSCGDGTVTDVLTPTPAKVPLSGCCLLIGAGAGCSYVVGMN